MGLFHEVSIVANLHDSCAVLKNIELQSKQEYFSEMCLSPAMEQLIVRDDGVYLQDVEYNLIPEEERTGAVFSPIIRRKDLGTETLVHSIGTFYCHGIYRGSFYDVKIVFENGKIRSCVYEEKRLYEAI